MNVEMICSMCGGTSDLMVVRQGKVICFDCMIKEYPDQMARLVYYLTVSKHVGTAK